MMRLRAKRSSHEIRGKRILDTWSETCSGGSRVGSDRNGYLAVRDSQEVVVSVVRLENHRICKLALQKLYDRMVLSILLGNLLG